MTMREANRVMMLGAPVKWNGYYSLLTAVTKRVVWDNTKYLFVYEAELSCLKSNSCVRVMLDEVSPKTYPGVADQSDVIRVMQRCRAPQNALRVTEKDNV